MNEIGVPEIQNPNDPPARSVIERIKARKERRALTLDLPIPAWDGNIVVRYKRLTPKQIAAASSSDRSQVVNARVLVEACDQVLAVDPETGELVTVTELLDDGNSAPVKFDGRLADAFSVKGERPDQIVRGIYEDDLTVAHHAQRLIKWQTGEDLDRVSEKDLEELAGED